MKGFDMREKYAIFALPFLDWRIDDNCMQIISQQQMPQPARFPGLSSCVFYSPIEKRQHDDK
ncbi:MAG TPA: hypothetical protein DC009_04530 [Porphyromonadaceae bacterium]|nr:hypothetical protein [Porphyromonadaceae bacterium]